MMGKLEVRSEKLGVEDKNKQYAIVFILSYLSYTSHSSHLLSFATSNSSLLTPHSKWEVLP